MSVQPTSYLWGKTTAVALLSFAVLAFVAATVQFNNDADQGQHSLPSITWLSGGAQRYDAQVDATVVLQLPGTMGQVNVVQRVAGTLNLRVFDALPDDIRVGLQFDPVVFEVNGQRDPAMESALTSTFTARFDDRGRIREIAFPEDLRTPEKTVLAETLRAFQIVLPEPDQADAARRSGEWTATEAHVTGRFHARYAAGDSRHISKEKQSYLAVDPGFGATRSGNSAGHGRLEQLSAQPLHSELNAWLDPAHSWLTDADMEERVVVRSGNKLLTDSTVRAQLRIIAGPPDARLALMKQTSWKQAVAQLRDTKSRPAPAAAEILDAPSLADQEHKLAGLVESLNTSDKGNFQLTLDIVRLLVEEPELAFAVQQALKSPALAVAAEPRFISALAMAGTREAQDVLVFISEDTAEAGLNRLRAIAALGSVDRQNADSFDALARIAQGSGSGDEKQLASTALLAIGALGSDARVRETLTQHLDGAASYRDVEVVLKAIGNTRDPALLTPVEPLLQHPSPAVRAAAAESLGRLKADRSLDLLTEQLASETDPKVRAAIAFGLYTTGAASSEALALVNDVIGSEPEERARYNMARYLGENLALFPDARATLDRLGRTDRSKRVRKYASNLILSTEHQAKSGS